MSLSARRSSPRPVGGRRGWPVVVVAVLTLSACGARPPSSTDASTDRSGPVSVSGVGGSANTVDNYVTLAGRPFKAPVGAVQESDGGRWSYAHPEPGRLTLLYFGYTSCPDVCPTTMADVAAALTRIPRGLRDRVAVQFVSTDPRRDTGPQIAQWLSGFDPGFRGGRAPIGSVIRAAAAYHISIDPPKVTKTDYQVTHGAQVLVLAPGGDAVGYFRELAGATAYASQLPALIRRYA